MTVLNDKTFARTVDIAITHRTAAKAPASGSCSATWVRCSVKTPKPSCADQSAYMNANILVLSVCWLRE